MVYLSKKKIKGNNYLYLNQQARVDGKSKRIWQIYLGPEDSVEKLRINIASAKVETNFKSFEFGLPSILLHYS